MSIEETLCPICNSKMKPAKSKFGIYWRCTRWGCEGTRDSMGRSRDEREQEKKDES